MDTFRVDDDRGSIGVGMVSDLIFLRSNPLKEIGYLRDISHVMRAGVLRSREELHQLEIP